MGNGKWEMGNGKWEMGNGKWEMGNGKWEMGNGKWEMGNGKGLKVKCETLRVGGWRMENGKGVKLKRETFILALLLWRFGCCWLDRSSCRRFAVQFIASIDNEANTKAAPDLQTLTLALHV
jgi:hypothetical protein